MHRELAARSRASTHRVFDDRFHNIHMAHPDAVVDAVDEILQAAGPAQHRVGDGPPQER